MNQSKKQNYKNKNFRTITVIIGVLFLTCSQITLAAQREVESGDSKEISYKIADGYGEYVGRGSTKIAAQSMARTACVMNKVSSYESRHNGLTPDEDTVDLYFDACINR